MSTKGSVAACAASDTPSASASQRRARPGAGPRSRAVSRLPQASSPAVAATDSWKPTSVAMAGSISSRPQTASPSAVAALPGRPDSRARSATPHIRAARTTLAPPPASSVYRQMTTMMSTDRPRRPTPAASSRLPTTPATTAMFQPLMATTWLRPVVAKSVTTSRATRITTPDQDARGQTGLRLRQHPRQRLVRCPTDVLDGGEGRGGAAFQVERGDARCAVHRRACQERRERASVGGHRFEAALEPDAVTRHDRGKSRQPRIDVPLAAARRCGAGSVVVAAHKENGSLHAAVRGSQAGHVARPLRHEARIQRCWHGHRCQRRCDGQP